MMSTTQFFDHSSGLKIAFRHTRPSAANAAPAVVFLPGYMSDMEGGKACAVFDHCAMEGRECLLLDYSGCGQSEGDFANGSLSIWRDEVLALIEAKIDRPIVLIGSSMGGWLMLLVGLALGDRLAGLIGIASAPDFTSWVYDEEQKAVLSAGGTIFQESDYGYDPMPTHGKFWQDGEANLLLGDEIAINCPVHLLHGQSDGEVPPKSSLNLAEALQSEQVTISLIKGGDHRLSRDKDIALLMRTLDNMT